MKAKMKKLISVKSMPVLVLVLVAGVVMMTGIAWAQSTEYSVNCAFTYGGTAIAKQWIDDEGVLHLRGITYGLTSDAGSGNMEIDIAGVCNHNYDLNTGDGNFWGGDHVVLVTWEGLTGTFRGSHDGIRVNHTEGYSSHVYQGIGGDFVGWKLRLDGTWDMGSAKAGVLEGILHNPHGE
ncbi:MAG: hypothetical protein ACYSWQ_12360 [Planctomycetota bacterium]|jgi:hypothetical protein